MLTLKKRKEKKRIIINNQEKQSKILMEFSGTISGTVDCARKAT